jgi:hypothetical protein
MCPSKEVISCTLGNAFKPDTPRQRPHNLHETYQLPSVQLITPDGGHRRCPKHVEFRYKINFGYLMHLVGYLYEAYHDARTLEHKVKQKPCNLGMCVCTHYWIRKIFLQKGLPGLRKEQ